MATPVLHMYMLFFNLRACQKQQQRKHAWQRRHCTHTCSFSTCGHAKNDDDESMHAQLACLVRDGFDDVQL